MSVPRVGIINFDKLSTVFLLIKLALAGWLATDTKGTTTDDGSTTVDGWGEMIVCGDDCLMYILTLESVITWSA
jgi:hypothetical protein